MNFENSTNELLNVLRTEPVDSPYDKDMRSDTLNCVLKLRKWLESRDVHVFGLIGDLEKAPPTNAQKNKIYGVVKENWPRYFDKGKPQFYLLSYCNKIPGRQPLTIVFVKAKNDNYLMKIGAPRHIPILFLGGEDDPIVFSGQGKGSNDKREVAVPLPKDAKSVDVSLKISGSMGSLLIYPNDGKVYVVGCSKNSTGNIFSEELILSFLSKFTTPNGVKRRDGLVKYLKASDPKVIAGETISSHPDVGLHGSKYQIATPMFVVWGYLLVDLKSMQK